MIYYVIHYACIVIIIAVSVLAVICGADLVWNERDLVSVILSLLSLIPFLMSIYLVLCILGLCDL